MLPSLRRRVNGNWIQLLTTRMADHLDTLLFVHAPFPNISFMKLCVPSLRVHFTRLLGAYTEPNHINGEVLFAY